MVIKKASKKIQPSPYVIGEVKKEKKIVEKPMHPMIRSTPKISRIGQGIQPKRDMTRFVKWPKYVRIQRQEKILISRLKAPPAINQFNITLDGKVAQHLLKFAKKYSPETKQQKKARLLSLAQSQINNNQKTGVAKDVSSKPYVLKYGLNHVTSLIEQKKAQLVIIAHDVAPLELIVWLPALCRKMQVPFVIVKNKARLGTLVHKKTASCVAFTRIQPEHKARFSLLLKSIHSDFEPRCDTASKKWSVPTLSLKSQSLKATA